jgi:hypothetical protein
MISQSTIVFFFLLAAFLIYITQRGELPAYLALLYGGGTPSPTPAPPGGGSASPPPASAGGGTTGGLFPTGEGGGLVPPGTGDAIKVAGYAAEFLA